MKAENMLTKNVGNMDQVLLGLEEEKAYHVRIYYDGAGLNSV